MFDLFCVQICHLLILNATSFILKIAFGSIFGRRYGIHSLQSCNFFRISMKILLRKSNKIIVFVFFTESFEMSSLAGNVSIENTCAFLE